MADIPPQADPAQTMPVQTPPTSAAPATAAHSLSTSPAAGDQAADGPTGFLAGLPEDLRAERSLAAIRSVEDMARAYVSAQKLVGLDRLPLPGADSPKEAWDVVYARLGRPDTPDGYAFAYPDGIDQERVGGDLVALFQQAAPELHALGVTKTQAAGLFKLQAELTAAQQAAAEQALTDRFAADDTALKTEWGAAYDRNLALARRGARELGGADELGALEAQIGAGRLIRICHRLGELLGEDKLVGGGAASGGGMILTPDQARQEIAARQRDADWTKAYFDKAHPGHKQAVAEMARLHRFAYPEVQGG